MQPAGCRPINQIVGAMFVVIEHDIVDPERFREAAEAAIEHIPSNLKLHQGLPSTDGTRGVCLWEADTLEEVRSYLERITGKYSKNRYWSVEVDRAIGLPREIAEVL